MALKRRKTDMTEKIGHGVKQAKIDRSPLENHPLIRYNDVYAKKSHDVMFYSVTVRE